MTAILDLFGPQEDEAEPVEPEALPEEPRARFAELLRRYEKLKKPDLAFATSAQERMENEILTHYDAKFPKSKWSVPPLPEKLPDGTRDRSLATDRWHAVRALGNKVSDTLVDDLLAKYSAEIAEHNKSRGDAAQDQLKEAGAIVGGLSPKPGAEWAKVSESWDASYRSQGNAAAWYAHGEAELNALEYQLAGFEVEVREDRLHGVRYEVWVKAEALEVEIARWKSTYDLRDRLREACRRTLNPRVYYPTLEHGIEARWGISTQGEVALGVEIRLVPAPKS